MVHIEVHVTGVKAVPNYTLMSEKLYENKTLSRVLVPVQFVLNIQNSGY